MRELLLASFGGWQYGIWKDAIRSVRDIHALHRIPLSPSRIAGIMMDDGQTVTLGDLSACIGYDDSAAIDQGYILLIANGEKAAGFAVNVELRAQSVSPELLFPLPDYLKTPVFDTCAVHDGISIPIINIAELYSRVLKTGKGISGLSPNVAAFHSGNISGVERIRFITVAGEHYTLPATDMDDMAVKPGPITPLPYTPRHVKGVTFREGQLLTVIDLAQRIKYESAAPDSLMLMMRNADTAFGLLVDGDGPTLPADKVTIKPLPLIAQSPSLKHLAVRTGELIPLIDLAMVLSPDSSADDIKPIWQRYTTGSGFPDIFFKHDVEVVEFSLLGERYALPKLEVEDIIIFKQPRALPDVPSIVIGVAEHDGEILPVVDLAMMFGRRSIATPEWRMMLVNNGDFRALVITETVFSERHLPPDMHRTVPIHLPHKLMYGCYPDGSAVRIILNVEAISVHFEKSLIQKFMSALSHEMRMSPTGVAYTFPEEKVGQVEKAVPADKAKPEEEAVEETLALEKEIPPRAESEPVSEAVPSDGFTPAEPELEQQAEQELVEWEEADSVSPAIVTEPEPMNCSGATEFSVDEWNAGAVFEQEHVQQSTEQAIAPETITISAELPENILPEGDTDRGPPGGSSETHKPEIIRNKSQLEELKASAKKKRKPKAAATATADSRQSETKFASTSAKSNQTDLEVEPLAIWSHYEERSAAQGWKLGIVYAAIVAALMVALYLSGMFVKGTSDNPVVEQNAPETQPAKIAQHSIQSEKSGTGTVPVKPVVDQATQQAEQAGIEAERAKAKAKAGAELDVKAKSETEAKPKQKSRETTRQTLVLSLLAGEQSNTTQAVEKLRATLELDIPKNKPTDINVYVVQEGDTLWSISEHFTGSPYNYPRIAGENRIADPDLILPGQRIRLIK